jgi:hypothetical protein
MYYVLQVMKIRKIFLVMAKIAAPIILELTKQPVEPSEMASLILNLLVDVGPSLPAPIQKSFFKKLSRLNVSSVVESNLGFEIREFNQCLSAHSVRRNNMQRRPSKSFSDVFIYNFLQNKTKKPDIYAIINEAFKFYVTVYNPFCDSIPATIFAPDQPTLRTERKLVLLKPEAETKVELCVKPIALQKFTIKSISKPLEKYQELKSSDVSMMMRKKTRKKLPQTNLLFLHQKS